MKRIFPVVALNLFFSYLVALDLEVHDTIGFFPKPILTLPKGINGISWSGNSFFAISAENAVYFARNEALDSQQIESPGGDIKYIKFVKDTETQNDILLVVTENNVIGVKTFTNASQGYLQTKAFNPDIPINSIDFSSDGNLIIMGLDNGEVHVMMQVYLTQKFSNFVLTEHKKAIDSVAFSPNSKYFLSAGKDWNINVWSVEEEGRKVLTLKSKPGIEIPVRFTLDSRYIISGNSLKTLIIRDFAGNTVQTITSPALIQKYSLSNDGRYLFVLGKNNLVYIFDIRSGNQMGYIPAFSSSPVTQFEFNKDETRLVIGYSDGTIFYLKTDEVILAPGAKPPKLGGKGAIGSSSFDRCRDDHDVEVRTECAFINDIFNFSPQVYLGYTTAAITNPVYFGVLAGVSLAFPSKDFPYKYWDGENRISNPNLLSVSLTVPIGVTLMPFKSDFEFFAEISVGLALYSLLQANLSLYGLYAAPRASFFTGVGFKRLCVYGGFDYDTVRTLSMKCGLSYRINLGSGQQ